MKLRFSANIWLKEQVFATRLEDDLTLRSALEDILEERLPNSVVVTAHDKPFADRPIELIAEPRLTYKESDAEFHQTLATITHNEPFDVRWTD